ncbi:MAG: hypothetical protein A3K22_04710 [Deltaproteobacteria bacterium RBG_16_42_7]|nr:MAG: hypothetical protein A3K22_04710 [Deltaproteobacteria bacterium RBG_16_42_7]
MNNLKSHLKRSRTLRTLGRTIKADINTLRSEGYRLWKSFARPGKIQNYLLSHEVKKLHLGAGPNIFEGWLNTDFDPQPDDVIFLDITEPLPFPDQTFDYIFSEHLIAQVPYKDAIFHLQECYRILKPGGKIRIATPDIQFLIDIYTAKDKTEIQKRYIQRIVDADYPEAGFYHATFVVNGCFLGWGVQFIYDAVILQDALRRAEFSQITRCAVKESTDSHLYNLEHHGTAISEEFNTLQTMVFEGSRLD